MKTANIAPALAATAMAATVATISGCGVSSNANGGVITLNSAPPPGSTTPGANVYVTEQTRDVANFHAVENKAVCTLIITDGQPFKVVVEGEEKVLPEVSTEVKDGVLVVNLDRNIHTDQPVRVKISMPKLDKYTTAGVGETQIKDVSEPFLTIDQSGAGSLSATGAADMVDLNMSGVGNANLSELQGKAVTALLSGTGNAKVNATESLTATVSGIGKLTYAGNPGKLQKNVTGLGSITAQ